MNKKSFDDKYQNLWDFIVKITHFIWEQRNVDSIRQFYHKDIKMHLPNGFAQGSEPVVQSTFEMLNAFPDRRLLPEDVIGSLEPEDALYSSHRIMNIMSKTGSGLFGDITQKSKKRKNFYKKILVRGIADCLVKNNQVIEEWLIRDLSGLLSGLGIDFKKYAHQQATEKFSKLQENDVPWHQNKCKEANPHLTEEQNTDPTLKDAKNYAEGLKAIWEQGNLKKIRENYHLSIRSEAPNSRILYGQEMLQQFYFGYLGAFSDVQFRIEHLAQEEPLESPKKLAVRWSVVAKHTGFGFFGEPSHDAVYIMGISHAYLSQGKIVAEWQVLDEVAILEQIFLNFFMKKKQTQTDKNNQ
jgi:predicted ester cyclase